MCGISGIYNYRGEPVDEQLLRSMLTSMYHRGPDNEGVCVNGDIGIGMRRLSIIDLVSGQQPIFNEDKSVAIVFNGEIYNYRQLASELRQRGHRLAINSDTEVIVHLYYQTKAVVGQEQSRMHAVLCLQTPDENKTSS